MGGRICQEIIHEAKEALGIDNMGVVEFRLMPYIQYLVINNQNIDPQRINAEERAILATWRKLGWIEGGARDLKINHKFWVGINKILWEGYVVQGGSSTHG